MNRIDLMVVAPHHQKGKALKINDLLKAKNSYYRTCLNSLEVKKKEFERIKSFDQSRMP